MHSGFRTEQTLLEGYASGLEEAVSLYQIEVTRSIHFFLYFHMWSPDISWFSLLVELFKYLRSDAGTGPSFFQ